MNKNLLTLAVIAGGGFVAYQLLKNRGAVLGGPANTVQGAGPAQGAYPGYPGPVAAGGQTNQANQSNQTNWGGLVQGIGAGLGSILQAFGVGKPSSTAQTTQSGGTYTSSITLPNYQLTDPTLDWGRNAGSGWATGATYADNLGFDFQLTPPSW